MLDIKNTPILMGTLVACSLAAISGVTQAADTIKSYTSSLIELDDSDANNKKIRLLFSVESAWNLDHIPEAIKEVKMVLAGGSGFDMTNIPQKTKLYAPNSTTRDWRYTVPTAFQLRVNYHDGATVRHWDHQPSNTVSSATVTETSSFSLGITSGSPPVISGGASWGTNISYNQAEFETVADYNQNANSVTWDILNKSIRYRTPPKNAMLYKSLNCSDGNLISESDLPVVMRSDFRPQAAVLYRKDSIADQSNTRFGLRAAWTKTHYHFARDWCNWYTDFTWKNYSDYSETTAADRVVSIGWADSLYR